MLAAQAQRPKYKSQDPFNGRRKDSTPQRCLQASWPPHCPHSNKLKRKFFLKDKNGKTLSEGHKARIHSLFTMWGILQWGNLQNKTKPLMVIDYNPLNKIRISEFIPTRE